VRKSFVLFGAALLVLGTSGTAVASVLNWEGTITFLLDDLPKSTDARGGGVATINGTSSLGHINTLRLAASRGQVKGTFTQFVTDPDTVNNGIAAIEYDGLAGGTGTLGPISGGVMSTTTLGQNTMSVTGTVRLCLVTTDCTSGLPLELFQTTANGAKGIGIGGLLTVGADSNVKISVQAAPWTIKKAVLQDQITTTGEVNQMTIDVTLSGFAHSAASSTSSTAAPSGVVQLVTPAQVRTNLPLGSNKLVKSGMTLFIHFIPEPGLLLLLGSGVAGLALLGRRRMRK
jgi:hypothetical protein